MTSPTSLVLPVPGDTTDIWGVALNACLNLLDQHDHTSGKGVPVPSAGLGIDADVSWSGFSITSLLATAFTPVAASAVSGYSNAFFCNSADGNLYWRTGSGNDVQVTSGAGLNLSATGGILGDYAAVSASCSFSDSLKDYLFQSEGSPRPWSGIQAGPISIFQKAASIANNITLQSPNSLAASYVLTLLAALPGSQSILQVGSTGTMVASNVLASNQNLQLQGSGYLQRASTFTTLVSFNAGTAIVAGGSAPTNASGAGVTQGSSSTILYPLGVNVGEWQLQSVSIIVSASSGATAISLETADNVSGGYDAIAGASAGSVSTGGNTLTPTTPSTLTAPLFLKVQTTSATSVTLVAAYPRWSIP